MEKINELIPEGEEPGAEIITEEEIPPLLEIIEKVAPSIEPPIGLIEEKETQLNTALISIGIIILIIIFVVVTYIHKKKDIF